MRLIGTLALFLVVVAATTPFISKDVALVLSELPVPTPIMTGDAEWLPAEQPIEVCFARVHIMPGQLITEKDIETKKVVVNSKNITGNMYPLSKDIIGSKSSAMIFAGGRFSAWNLESKQFSQRKRIGHSTNPLERLKMEHALSHANKIESLPY